MCGCNKLKSAPRPQAQAPMLNRLASPAPAAVLETVDTSIWGASLWKILHIAAQVSNSKGVIPLWRGVFDAMRTGLPCPDCSAHYNAWYKARPLQFSLIPMTGSTRGPIVNWILELHNNVNRRTGKPTWTGAQLAGSYGGNQIATAKSLADSLRGVIGGGLSAALDALLRSL